MKAHLLQHHKSMAALHKRIGDSMDDDHEMKSFHTESARHHGNLVKALELGDDVMPNVGSESRRGSSDLVPTKVRQIFQEAAPVDNLRLIGRAGGPPLEKAKVSAENEELFGGL